MRVREAAPGDHLDVMRILDAAVLAADAETVADRIAAGTVLVAVAQGSEEDERVLGALVAAERDDGAHAGTAENEGADADAAESEGAHVEAIAVRRRRRGRGVGTALVEVAGERWTPLTAEFDERVLAFYESLGFDCERVAGESSRYLGTLE